jgi:hypothetical protein
MSYKEKYLKYKSKYLALFNQIGGGNIGDYVNYDKGDEVIIDDKNACIISANVDGSINVIFRDNLTKVIKLDKGKKIKHHDFNFKTGNFVQYKNRDDIYINATVKSYNAKKKKLILKKENNDEFIGQNIRQE